jgi:glycerol-3-phosphate dehydrogenase (NAD(P)+)
MITVGILGEGAWGTAIATLLAHNNITVKLWCYDPAVARNITLTRYNGQYLPGVYLDTRIVPVTDIAEAVSGVDYVFEAIPVQFLRSVIEQAKPHVDLAAPWVFLSKGIEKKTLLFASQIMQSIFPKSMIAVLYGPSYAKNVAKQECTAVTLGVSDLALGNHLQHILNNDYFKTYISHDCMGAQVGAALKNVLALGVGILEGAGYGDNVKAYMATRGLQEMVLLSIALGGSEQTIYGLSGVGDLILTAFGTQSKNQHVGKQIGSGLQLQQIKKEMPVLPEGINTLEVIPELAKKYTLDLPIFQGIYKVIFKQLAIERFLEILSK